MNVLVTGARAPIAADLARALALAGHQVWVTDSLRFPLAAASPHIRGLIRLPPPRTAFPDFLEKLLVACATHAIDAIVPTSEEVLWLARAAPSLPATVNVRTSPLSTLVSLHHKGSFAALATRLGYGAAENHELFEPADLAPFFDSSAYVFKPVYSRFATRTLIGPSQRELARLRPTSEQPWLAQTRLHGRELCAYNVADRGRLLLHVAYEPRFRFGVGASTYFAPLIHDGLRSLCEQFIAATHVTGQISFDVMETSEKLVALECNPRGTSGVHLAVQAPAALAGALLGQHLTPATPPFAPRMLWLPLLLNHPGAWFRARDRALLRCARDAMTAADISVFAQMGALAELTWQAAQRGLDLASASTTDFEWNGETRHAHG